MGTRFGKALFVGVAALIGTAAGAVVTRVGVVDAVTPPPVGAVVVPVTPTRILDTRSTDGGPIGGPSGSIGAGAVREVKAAGVTPVPADATGVVLNITAVNATASSFITVWPTGTNRPNASTLNPAQGQTRFNSATVLLGTGGSFSVYHSAGNVDVLIDVVGYLVGHDHDDRYYTKALSDARYAPAAQVLDLDATSYTAVSGAMRQDTGGCVELTDAAALSFALPLPAHARVSSLVVKTREVTSPGFMTVALVKSTFTASAATDATVTSLASADNVNSIQPVTLPGPLDPVGDGVTYRLDVSAPSHAGFLGFCGATVGYTIDPTLVAGS
jgi:hypothetical protein